MTPLPEPVAHLRIAKKWDGEPIPVACNESHEKACGVFTEAQMKAYGAAEYKRAILDAMNATGSFGKTGEVIAMVIRQLGAKS